VKLATPLNVVLRLRMSGALPPPPVCVHGMELRHMNLCKFLSNRYWHALMFYKYTQKMCMFLEMLCIFILSKNLIVQFNMLLDE
jgi:hypothetical protein